MIGFLIVMGIATPVLAWQFFSGVLDGERRERQKRALNLASREMERTAAIAWVRSSGRVS